MSTRTGPWASAAPGPAVARAALTEPPASSRLNPDVGAARPAVAPGGLTLLVMGDPAALRAGRLGRPPVNNYSTATARARPAKGAPPAASPVKVSDVTIRSLSDVFKMLADRSRLTIVLALAQDGELHVSALCDLLGQSQPAVSHHLTLMRMAGLVGYRRDGKHNFYHLASRHV